MGTSSTRRHAVRAVTVFLFVVFSTGCGDGDQKTSVQEPSISTADLVGQAFFGRLPGVPSGSKESAETVGIGFSGDSDFVLLRLDVPAWKLEVAGRGEWRLPGGEESAGVPVELTIVASSIPYFPAGEVRTLGMQFGMLTWLRDGKPGVLSLTPKDRREETRAFLIK